MTREAAAEIHSTHCSVSGYLLCFIAVNCDPKVHQYDRRKFWSWEGGLVCWGKGNWVLGDSYWFSGKWAWGGPGVRRSSGQLLSFRPSNPKSHFEGCQKHSVAGEQKDLWSNVCCCPVESWNKRYSIYLYRPLYKYISRKKQQLLYLCGGTSVSLLFYFSL